MNETELYNWLATHRTKIVDEWTLQVMPGSPSEQRNRFTNPMYYTIHLELDLLYGKVLERSEDLDDYKTTQLMKIQALHNTEADQATAFSHILKEILENAIMKDGLEITVLSQLDLQVQLMAEAASLQFMKNREKLESIKQKERNSRVFSDLPPDSVCPSSFLHNTPEKSIGTTT
ncbi:MAG: hypothetical protein ABUK01_10445 [Leptospirales bacterium]